MIASCSDLSVSSINCSAPPLIMIVQVLLCGHPIKILYLKPENKNWKIKN